MIKLLNRWLQSTDIIANNIKSLTLNTTHPKINVNHKFHFNGIFQVDLAFQRLQKQQKEKSKQYAIIKKNVYSTIIRYYSTNNNFKITLANTRKSSSLHTNQMFTFSIAEQGAIVESFLVFAEKALYNFLVKYKNKISNNKLKKKKFCEKRSTIKIDIQKADVHCMLNYITLNIEIFMQESAFHGKHKDNPTKLLKDFAKNVRHKIAHGIVDDDRGRWCDFALRQVVDLTCEVVSCLGSDYNKIFTVRDEFYDEINKRLMNRR
jgi:hypothetical protein